MPEKTNIAIIGGGITGCAIAYFLRKSGINVIVFDRGEIGAEASSAAAGILAPLGSLSGPGSFADLLLASWKMFPALIPELEAASGVTTEYEQSGTLHVARSPQSVKNLRKRMEEWQPLGLEMHWLDGSETRGLEPSLASDVAAAVYAPQEAQAKAPQLMRAFALAAANLGAVLRAHTKIAGVQRQGQRVTGITTAQGETITCDQLVIATGAWSARWSEWLDLLLPVTPQRGQILTLRQPATPIRQVVFGEAIYFAPKQDNTIVVGATKEEVGFDTRLTAGGISWLLSTAIRLAPSLEGSTLQQMWAGLRPHTPDHHPILGRAPGWENVSLAIGHNSVGILLSAITGQSLVELLATGSTPEVIRAFGVERFAG